MQNLHELYQHNIQKFQAELKKIKSQLFASSMLRLVFFLVLMIGIYFFYTNTKIVVGIILLGILGFIFLVKRHTNIHYQKQLREQLIEINQTEIEVLNHNFTQLSDGSEFQDSLHEFSNDIDLFGKKSFFQYLNRTSLANGKIRLAHLLIANTIQEIPQKQEAVKELASKLETRQFFSATASLIKAETSSDSISKWLVSYQKFVPKMMKWLPKVFSGISLIIIVGFFLDFVTWHYLLAWFFIGLFITSRFLKKINLLSHFVSKSQDTFQQYYQLIGIIEKESFNAKFLSALKRNLTTENSSSSQILQQFSKRIDALDQRNNLLFGALGNGFLLWDLHQSYQLESWISTHQNHVKNWFDTLATFDAYMSLGNFAYNHPDYTFPKINKDKSVMKATNLAHPLLFKKVVKNDFEIKDEQFFIITGANMAGKSTFLRTVSLHILMANIGLPVCADSSEYSPIKLITSMRTSDSLAEESSYFFAELSRLQFIVNKIKSDKYFIILDEILKGTNSKDKAIGSQKFIEKLVHSNSTGIIATHDLSLCEVEQQYEEVKNYYFDAQIINDELFFDYQFKKGICQNMNASFLLKKMKIVN
ncbi:DNA mismatch repair protein MutS [Mesonia sp. K7]|uniref:MutS-related protein n=1 Tax=Mesonia sp. K7 TaxID=2218606 RepID=UPI000DAA376C|nr:DNA mismatch repair protein MutS [Mesonia sp. K7]PZD79603.1 DNA mismatch repair protein MutS [Mesonia sp. K7]